MTSKSEKVRIDKWLVDQKIISTRARAQAMIMAGKVLVDDEPVTKPGQIISTTATIRLKEPESKYVSRGAYKLIAALDHFKIKTENSNCLDVGSSTGGFTQVLLERNVNSVVCLDVGTNQLAWPIRSDPKVKVMENVNARYVKPENFETLFDLIVMDVSFISVQLIIPALKTLLTQTGKIIFLFKPQFELGPNLVEKGGIVKDQNAALEKLKEILSWCESIGFYTTESILSPIEGTDGNQEYLTVISMSPL